MKFIKATKIKENEYILMHTVRKIFKVMLSCTPMLMVAPNRNVVSRLPTYPAIRYATWLNTAVKSFAKIVPSERKDIIAHHNK